MDALLKSLSIVTDFYHITMLMYGSLVGLAVGILPGIGGLVGMSILLPFIYGMEPHAAFALLIGMFAVCPTADTFTSILMGIPGASGSAATIMDGYPLARKGEAARALSASFTSSLIGGLFGAIALTMVIPFARPIVLAFGSPELLMLSLWGISMVGVLSAKRPLKGFLAAGLGIMIGTIGAAPAAPEYRYTFGIEYLKDGIPLVILALGLFAIPEIMELLIKGSAISEVATLGKGWLDGVKDAIHHKFIILRCSIIGVIIGIIPGLGGGVVNWLAYGHVIQTSRERENFGKGDIRGVVAPESANNAVDGGALIPTLLFGIPGSGAMAVFLGGLYILGIQPGPNMITTNLDLFYTAVWSLATANVIGAGMCIFLAKPITRLTVVPFSYLAPFMALIIVLSAYQASQRWEDLIALLLIGILGLIMKQVGYSRPAFIIGYVLSDNIETYLFISMQRYGLSWLFQPGVLILALIIITSLVLGILLKPREISKLGESNAT